MAKVDMARIREGIEIARQRQDDDEWRAILRLLEAYERDPDNEKGELAPAAAPSSRRARRSGPSRSSMSDRPRPVPDGHVDEIREATRALMFCEPEVEADHKRRLAHAMNALADWAGLAGGRLQVPARPPREGVGLLASMTFKRCACGCAYTMAQWHALELVGHQEDTEISVLELRNCSDCGSTISVTLRKGDPHGRQEEDREEDHP